MLPTAGQHVGANFAQQAVRATAPALRVGFTQLAPRRSIVPRYGWTRALQTSSIPRSANTTYRRLQGAFISSAQPNVPSIRLGPFLKTGFYNLERSGGRRAYSQLRTLPSHFSTPAYDRRKNVSYFRGRNPWRDASQSQRPVDKKPSGQAIHEAKEQATSKSPWNNKTILNRLPELPARFHRPSKEELLAAATGFWSRLGVRFKWFSIRSLRPFNMDDISAFFSWILLGHVIWILVGTTTFFSLLILTVNTVFAQETLARWVGNYLTKSSGVKVIFESAIVPRWKDGVITFKNVFVSRRPGLKKATVSKGSPTSAQAAVVQAEKESEDGADVEDTNYTQYDVNMDTVNVTLSFAKWFNGKGLLKDVEIKGVRGVLDRTLVHWNGEYVDPRSYRHEHNTGDFELESFKLDDLLVSVYQPGNFRPFSVSVFSADLPQLRKQWLFHDLLSANHVSGSYDDSPFFIHPRQVHNYTGQLLEPSNSDESPDKWKKQSRIRIDGLNIDHLNRGIEGPFSWIREGNVDIVTDVMFPVDDDESISRVISDFYDRVEATVTDRYLHTHPQLDQHDHTSTFNDTRRTSSNPPEPKPPEPSAPVRPPEELRFLVMDLRLHLNNVRAGVPIFTRDLSYVNNALIRPIVAYINNPKHHAFIPVNCRVVKPATDFDGSWTVFDSGLMEDLSRETYDAFARDVVDDQARMRRIKKVGLWSLQVAVQAFFLGLAGNMAA
ncbi:MAG: Mitochondrial distribution and morphology protein 31, mitochondrial precursor [Alyxoria varia]|nr:MAG: Mitochondrial distribution and morphology protein 31, mitochondrial precursor [Alyxoria varia]